MATDTPFDTGIFRIGGRRYVVGLKWDIADRRTVTNKRDLLAQARSHIETDPNHPELVVLRASSEETPWQFGLAPLVSSARGAVSAAAVAAERIKGSWIAVVKIGNEGWWFLQISDDIIITDMFYTQEDEVREVFARARRSAWQLIYGPEEWNTPRDTLDKLDLAAMLQGHTTPRLVRLSSFGNAIKLLGAAILGVTILGGGAGLYFHHQASVRAEQEAQAQQARALAFKAALLRQHQMIKVEAPWRTSVRSGDFIDACEKALHTLPHYLPEYANTSYGCSGTYATAQFLRSGGTPSWALNWFNAHYASPLSLMSSPDGTKETVTLPLPKLPLRGGEAIFHTQPVQQAFYNRKFLQNSSLELSQPKTDVVNIPATRGVDANSAPSTPWARLEYTITSDTRQSWEDFIRKLPGSTVNKMTYDPVQNTWVFEGAVYVLH